ncbi:hypothetical protein EON80_19125, partial [bacterium]
MKARTKTRIKDLEKEREEWKEKQARRPRGVRAEFWAWLSVWDGSPSGFAAMPISYDNLRLAEVEYLHQRVAQRCNREVCRCIVRAAELTLSDYTEEQTVKIYTRPQLLALVALRQWLGVHYRAVVSYIKKHESERFLIFERSPHVPTWNRLRDFEATLTPA